MIIIHLIIFLVAQLFILYFPGLLLFRLLYPGKKLSIIEGPALFFAMGVFYFIIPMTISYFTHQTWYFLISIWMIEILSILLILFIKKSNPLLNLFSRPDRIDLILLASFIIISITMFFHGAHFTGDASGHLSYIMRLSSKELIDPYAPIIKNTGQISFNYAYCLWYGIFALFIKLTYIDLRILWDLSPCLFSFLIGSALYFFTSKIIKDKKFIFISFIIFYIYEFSRNWMDYKYLPYPDQIARNILLFLAFGFLFEKLDKKRNLYINAFVLGLLMCSIVLIHMYSFFAFYFIGSFLFIGSLFFFDDEFRRKHLLISYTISLIIILPFLFLRLFYSTYYERYIMKIFNI